MDNVSVIIRSKNEQDHVGFAIQSCLDYLKDPQIIVVDNESTDDTLGVVNLFVDRADIKIVSIEKDQYTPGRSINMGVREADQDTCLVLSAHCQIRELNNTWPRFHQELEAHCAVFGKQIPIYMGKKITPRYIWSHFGDEEVVNMYSTIEDRLFLHNAFCFYKRETLLDYPMPESYSGKEDRYWAIDMVDNGHKFLYWPQLVTHHYYTNNGATWRGMS